MFIFDFFFSLNALFFEIRFSQGIFCLLLSLNSPLKSKGLPVNSDFFWWPDYGMNGAVLEMHF